jgi:hypothetical protein
MFDFDNFFEIAFQGKAVPSFGQGLLPDALSVVESTSEGIIST